MQALRTGSHADAGPRTGRNLNAPQRTRTFDLLIKSQQKNGLHGVKKADSDERVSESVSGVFGPQDGVRKLLAAAEALAKLTPEQVEALMRLGEMR